LYHITPKEESKEIKFKPHAVISGGAGKHTKGISGISWYPVDTGIFTTSSFDHTLKVWDTNKLTIACSFSLQSPIQTHAFSPFPGNDIIAANEDSRIVLCDLRSGSFSHTLTGHSEPIYAIKWSPNEQFLLATGSADKKIKFWDIRRAGHLACLATLNQHYTGSISSEERTSTGTSHNGAINGLQFTPDGLHLLSSGTDSRVRLWDVYSKKNTLVNYGKIENKILRNIQFDVSKKSNPGVIFHPIGNKILMLDLFTGEQINRLSGHFGRVKALQFHPIYPELYSVGENGEMLIWSPLLESRIFQEEFDNSGSVVKNHHHEEDNWSD